MLKKKSKNQITIFLASSNELEADRRAFEIMISRKSNLWKQENKPEIHFAFWEIYSDAMSQTRSQDEYNKLVKEADIFVMLLWTKAGKYTQEEFLFARDLFYKTANPSIYIYKKHSDTHQDSLTSFLEQFNINNEEYFFGEYDAFSTLESRFIFQLDAYCIKKYPVKISEVEKNRLELLEGLERRYNKRREKKMETEINFQLDLALEYTTEGTTEEWIKDYFAEGYENKSAEEFNTIFREFETRIKRLLILGEPGSGKTVLLLQFALRLIGKARNNTAYPLPIIVNLASWRNEYHEFETWLEENLVFAAGEYGTAKKYAKELVEEKNLLLLLDGLDEIPEEHRASCMHMLHNYTIKNENKKALNQNFPELIICCRKNEYKELVVNAPVKASLYISPLKPEYLINALKSINKENSSANILINRINENPEITECLDTAFDVHLALHLSPNFDFKTFSKQEILDEYIVQEIKKVKGCKEHKSFRYLQYLAYILSQTNKAITFEMIDMQPFWININLSKIDTKLYSDNSKFYKRILLIVRTILLSLFIGVSFFLLIIFFAKSSDERADFGIDLIGSLALGLFFGLIICIALYLINKKSEIEIAVREAIRFNPKEFSVSKFIKSFTLDFKKTFLFALALMIFFSFFMAIGQQTDHSEVDILSNIPKSFKSGISGIKNELFAKNFSKSTNEIIFFIIVVLGVLGVFMRKRKSLGEVSSNNKIKKYLKIIYNYFSNFIVYLFYGWVFQSVILGFFYGLLQSELKEFYATFIISTLFSAILGSVFGFISGLFKGIVDSFFSPKRSLQINKAYNRFYSSFIFEFLKIFIPLSTIFPILFFLIDLFSRGTIENSELQAFFIYELMMLIYVFLVIVYNSSLTKHVTVRIILFLQKNIPFRYRTFLNEVSKTGLMEKDGGQWRFRHQLIQDRLAAHDFNLMEN